jgi:hypothetical protein
MEGRKEGRKLRKEGVLTTFILIRFGRKEGRKEVKEGRKLRKEVKEGS